MEFNLLTKYPKTQRNLDARLNSKTEEHREIARRFDRAFFDGSRDTGYGGYSYNPRFWRETTKYMLEFYQVPIMGKVLDVGCAKGFMLYDFKWNRPDLDVFGIDISEYAIQNALPEVKCNVAVGCASDLSRFADKSFDLVVSINTVHNLPLAKCKKALKEIDRVAKNSFITVDAWFDAEQKKRMEAWNLTALTMMSVEEWRKLFTEIGYSGDYYWFIP